MASIQQRTSLVKFLVRKSFSVAVRQQAGRLVGFEASGSLRVSHVGFLTSCPEQAPQAFTQPAMHHDSCPPTGGTHRTSSHSHSQKDAHLVE